MSIEIIDMNCFLNREEDPAAYKLECAKVTKSLHDCGLVILKDPRVFQADNDTFLDMMQSYFELSDGMRDARPEHHFQVGVTPAGVEKARNHCTQMGAYGEDDKPLSPCPPEADAKWRFFWRIGPSPETTKFPSLNMSPVVPPEFPQWTDVMNMWGGKMIQAVFAMSEMAAIGFDLPADTFTNKMSFGPHLLAPTGSDFNKYGQKDHTLAGFHSDLNLFTIHGKSRFPGLFAWTREGKKISVAVPEGCLLVQAGKQIEYLTGGHVLAGFHEVVVTDATVDTINRRRAAGESLWRVSSTLFSHVSSDDVLEPVGQWATPAALEKFPKILAGDFVQEELKAIKLAVNPLEAEA